jgi:DNA-binding beta-propeller fold protein YncE
MAKPIASLACVLLSASAALGAAPKFTRPPTAARVGDGVRITFAVSAPTDCEVAVLDAAGKVVRHLAAGMLGAKEAPPAPLRAGLSQSISWDGRDDHGRRAEGGPFEVRVRLGLTPTFSHFIGESRQAHGVPMGLGCDAAGNLYVMYRWGMSSTHYVSMGIKVFDRNGKYVRRMVPYAANLAPEKRSVLQWLGPFDDGPAVPMIYTGHNRDLYPEIGAGGLYARIRHSMCFRADGKLVTTSYPSRYPSGMKRRRVIVFGPDGGAVGDFLGPALTWNQGDDERDGDPGGNVQLALSPDSRTIYLTGGTQKRKPIPAVLRTTWNSQGSPEVFLGDRITAGTGPKQFAEPRGITTDAQGNIYVADFGNNRVAAFSAAGEPLGQVPVSAPVIVLVHPKTGAVYVVGGETMMSKGRKVFKKVCLFKFRSCQDPATVAELELGARYGHPIACLDATADPAVLYVTRARYGAHKIDRIVDKGSELENQGAPIESAKSQSEIGSRFLDLMVDRTTEEVWVKEGGFGYYQRPAPKRYDGASGKYLGSTRLQMKASLAGRSTGEGAFSPDGQTILYCTSSHTHAVLRRDGTVVRTFGPLPQGHIHSRGAAVGPDGTFYVLHHRTFRDSRDSLRGVASHLSAAGEVLRKAFIQVDAPVGGIEVDLKGNVYVGAHVKPKGQLVPGYFKDKLPKERKNWRTRWYADMYGSVLKFKPSGGKLCFGEGGLVGKYQKPLASENLVWAHYGLSPISSRDRFGAQCICQLPRFDVDAYGRVWVPDVFRFSVQVLDNNATPITRFGGYGNEDSRGPKSPIKTPAIPFGWVHAVQVTDDYAYMADVMNHRVVAVKLAAGAAAQCRVP